MESVMIKANNKYYYQQIAAKQVLKNALNKKYTASVLAACPGAGKTTISHLILNMFFRSFPTAKVVVLTEGKNFLKDQYLFELQHAHVGIKFTYGTFDTCSQVQIGIPQALDSLNLAKIDLLIVDEAHNFYNAQTIKSMIKKTKPTYQILMTGSPKYFNQYNHINTKKYAIYYIAAQELQQKQIFNNVDMDVLTVDNRLNPYLTIKQTLQQIKKSDCMDKIMIACPNVEYASCVASILHKKGRKISISTYLDHDNKELNKFKTGITDTLIVVEKGVLGFNDENITLLIDMKCSANIDKSYQLFARILRKHPDNIRKVYYRVANKNQYNREVLQLHKIYALTKSNIFKKFTGKNLKLIVR